MSSTRPTKKSSKKNRTYTPPRKRIRKTVKSCTEDLRAARELVEESNRLVAAIARYPLLIWIVWSAVATGGDTAAKLLVIVEQLLGLE